MRADILYKKNAHKCIVMGRDPKRRENVIDTNHYLIENNGQGLLIDPGGVENFSVVAAEFSRHFDLANLQAIFASHQDPDVISSISLWIQANPKLIVYVPKIWLSFITHYGVSSDNLQPIPDEGGLITLGGHDLEVVPAHYLHSPGNLSLYDPDSRVFYCGDIGTSILPENNFSTFVENFSSHTAYMEYFHRRWMSSNSAKSRWIAEVRKRDVDMLCPQHGSIFRGEDVHRFLSWFENIDVGSGWSNSR